MPLTKPQQRIFNDTSRFRVVAAGRRFGKTFLSMYEIARVARHPNKRVLYLAMNFRQAKSILWENLKYEMVKRRWVKKINESELSIRLVNGSLIELRSAEAAEGIRGISCDMVVLDECAFYKKSVWTDIIRPTLSDRKGGALFISTPQGLDWFYDLYNTAKSGNDWSSYQYTTLEGGNVDAEEVEAAKQDLDLATFRQEYEATFESSGNRIYHAFDSEHNVQDIDFDIPKHLYIGMDFNVSPMSAVIGAKTENGLHIFDEIALHNSNTDEMAQTILERYPGKRITVFPDPAGNQRRSSARGKTDHAILQEYGFTVRVHRAHPQVKDRINAVNRLLQNAAGQRNLYLTATCKKVIEGLLKHQYKEGTTTIPDKDSGYDHHMDALGYMTEYLYPVRRREQTPVNPGRFAHY